MSSSDEKEKKDDETPQPPGSPDRTPVEDPEKHKPMGDPQPPTKKKPRL